MHAEDRPIHFAAELIHRPVQRALPTLQKLYFDLTQTRAAYQSTEFSTPGQAKFYSKGPDKAHSAAVFLPDRVLLVEEWTGLAYSEFTARVQEVLARGFKPFEITDLLAHSVTIRTTFSLTHYQDARAFLLDRVCAQKGCVGLFFQRPLAIAGLRFVLPETPECRGVLHVAIESFRHDPREVFVEVKGVFAGQTPVHGFESIAMSLAQVRAFITDNVYPYLNQFDEPQEA